MVRNLSFNIWVSAEFQKLVNTLCDISLTCRSEAVPRKGSIANALVPAGRQRACFVGAPFCSPSGELPPGATCRLNQ